jgi:hypothetical protein
MRKIMGLGIVLMFGAAPLAAQETPRAIVERAIQAHGGRERLAQNRADKVKLKGTLQVGAKGIPFMAETTVQLPSQLKSVMELNDGNQKYTLVQILNGDQAYITVNGQPQPIEPAALAELRETLQLDRAVRLAPLLTDRTFDLAPLGESKVGDRPVVGIKVTAKGRQALHLYFEKATNLLIKSEHMLTDGRGKEVRQEQFYSDFRDLGGYKRPIKMTAFRDGKKVVEVELVDVKYLDKIDPAEFAKP